MDIVSFYLSVGAAHGWNSARVFNVLDIRMSSYFLISTVTDKLNVSQLSLFNYIIDAYLPVAASAVAACTVCRSLAGGAFPVRTMSLEIVCLFCRSAEEVLLISSLQEICMIS